MSNKEVATEAYRDVFTAVLKDLLTQRPPVPIAAFFRYDASRFAISSAAGIATSASTSSGTGPDEY